MPLSDPIAIVTSSLLMAATIVASAAWVLGVRPLPWVQALVIASAANLLGKVAVSWLHWPGVVSYAVPTAAYFGLSVAFFRPAPRRLLPYWLAGFALYLAVHVAISWGLGWTFMFPFWVPLRRG